MKERTATVEHDERGRLTIPKAAREALGIDGQEGYVEITIRVDDE